MRTTITSLEQLNNLVPQWYGRSFAFDVETSGLDYRTSNLLGLALTFPIPGDQQINRKSRDSCSYDQFESFYIVLGHTVPLWDGTVIYQTHIEYSDFTKALLGLFAQTNVLQVAHNSKFDMHFLHKHDVMIRGQLFDTLLAAQLIDENRANGLKDLAVLVGVNDMVEYRTLHEYDGYGKDEILGVPLPKASNYAMNDTETTWLLYEKFKGDLAADGLEDAFYNVWMPLVPVLQSMEARGITLDVERVNEVGLEYSQIAIEQESIVRQEGIRMILERYPNPTPESLPKYYLRYATEEELATAYEDDAGNIVTNVADIPVPILEKASKAYKPRVIDFNTGSKDQLHELVFDHLGITVPDGVILKRSPKTQTVALDKDNVSTLLFYLDDPHPTLQAVLDWRKASKFLGTYIERFQIEATEENRWRISTNFGQDNVKTGRLSSSSPNLNCRAA